MSEIPHITIPKMRSTGDDWCVHYAGFYDRNAPMQKRRCCDVGVEYASVEKKVEFTTQRHDEAKPYQNRVAHPCFQHQAHLTDGCPKAKYLSPEELAAKHAARDRCYERIGLIRKAILEDLKGAKGGMGTIDCPACKTGKVRYSRANCNGHVHAACSTDGCASWME